MRSPLLAALPLCLLGLSGLPAHAEPVCDNDGRCRQVSASAPSITRVAHQVRHASAVLGGRPTGCPHAWCGCWLGLRKGMRDRSLWVARNWARVGSPASGPAPGVIAVWRHHVGEVTGVPGPGRIILLSGNDGRAVRERERSSAGVIAWRRV